ncbi:hypothetical protein SDC9_58145 [bioreactor metagenome]|uniref:Uncharacterized protein n=1 Tax=bioreactor metagenome TaxID=1076179 RepID=A0A644XC91_9ZZZZ
MRFGAECVKAELKNGVQVTHQYQRDLRRRADPRELLEEHPKAHAVLECLCPRRLDDGTVCHRVAERDAYFNQFHTVFFERLNDRNGVTEVGESGREIDG